jgi:hypothetical protein
MFIPLAVEERQFLPSTGHLIVTGGIDEGWGEVETSPFLFAACLVGPTPSFVWVPAFR